MRNLMPVRALTVNSQALEPQRLQMRLLDYLF